MPDNQASEPGELVPRSREPERLSRRRFAAWGTAISGALVSLTLGIPIVGYLVSPLFARKDPLWEKRIGSILDLVDEQPARFVVRFPQNAWLTTEEEHTVYVVKHGADLDVFANTCTHMQCPVRFHKDINQFLCPCHGGLYDLHGTNVGGPPPKPLPRYTHRVDGDGVLYVKNELNEQI
ncbi:MAG TPA: ubiquinol-cytochrome c reductase iron-sulfur subunit [Candidatus Dormibacteraeota bacterium]|nr:ubiquinol-cytochrome c reductase iron-sulfur subunit [Candidatus Dormibacteraeota bacterium]